MRGNKFQSVAALPFSLHFFGASCIFALACSLGVVGQVGDDVYARPLKTLPDSSQQQIKTRKWDWITNQTVEAKFGQRLSEAKPVTEEGETRSLGLGRSLSGKGSQSDTGGERSLDSDLVRESHDRAGTSEINENNSSVPAAATPDNARGLIAVSERSEGEGTSSGSQKNPEQLYTFQASNLDIRVALALFAQQYQLNIVPDGDITGTITVDIRGLPLNKAMEAILAAHDYWWEEKDGLIRIHSKKTEVFYIDYLRLIRRGQGQSSAMLGSGGGGLGGFGGIGGIGGGIGGGFVGGGFGGGTVGGGAGFGIGGAASVSASMINLRQDNEVDFWRDLEAQIKQLLTSDGVVAISPTAGIVQVTDRPSGVERVRQFLSALLPVVQRQVEIEAEIYEVVLNNQFQFGIDWSHAVRMLKGVGGASASVTSGFAAGGVESLPAVVTLTFENQNTRLLLEALEQQGEVQVISRPRVRTLNNQTALIKVGTDMPFFTRRTTYIPGVTTGVTTSLEQDEVTLVTIGTILAITPQVSSDGWITLDISPVLTSLVEIKTSPTGTTTAPVVDIKQASTIVRVRDGTTVVLGGLIRTEQGTTVRKVPFLGDIPLLGEPFKGRVNYNKKRELVIFVTPHLAER